MSLITLIKAGRIPYIRPYTLLIVGEGRMSIRKVLKTYLKLLLSNPKLLILLLLIAVSLAGTALGKPEVSPLDGNGSSDGPGTPYPHPDPT